MSWPYRPGERREATPGPEPGVLVLTPEGKRYFFPGGSKELAMIYARMQLGAVLEDRLTRIEFGERDGGLWSAIEVLKKSDLPDARQPDHPQVIVRRES